METLGLIFALGGLVIGAGMALYAMCLASYTNSTKAAWKIVGLAVWIVIVFWMIGVTLFKLGG